MPTTRRSRTLAAAPEAIWDVVGDPAHLPRWWPRVTRVEGVGGGRFTQVLTSKRGKAVRADYRLVDYRAPRHCQWVQELEGTPFERLLSHSAIEVRLDAAEAGTKVTLALAQRLRGINRLGGLLLRRASRAQLDEALDGLERACVG